MKTELVPEVTGPGKGPKEIVLVEQRGSLKGDHCDQMVMDALDPLNKILESRHVVQQLVLVSLAFGFPYFCSCDFHACTSWQFAWTPVSSFFDDALAYAFTSTCLLWCRDFQEDGAKAKKLLLLDQGVLAMGSHCRSVGMHLRDFQEVDSTGLGHEK